MPAIVEIPRDLRDREIMLDCLAHAADAGGISDLCAGEPARRLLDLRRRGTRTLRHAERQRAMADRMRGFGAASARSHGDEGRPSVERLLSGASVGRLVLELRRSDLAVQRAEAADLRGSARALRAESQQIQRRIGR